MSNNSQLTQEQMKAVDSYANQIKTLKDFVTAVKKTPGMWIGPIGSKGFLNMCREIWQNSLDQILDPNSPGSWFSFFYDERTLEVEVIDNGLGFPFNDIIRILTTQNTSKNYEKKLGEYSSGLHGCGSKIVNALSSIFIVESYRYDGTAVRMEFKEGYPLYEKPKSIPNKSNKQGSKVYFVPNLDIMGDIDLSWKTIYTLLKNMVSLTCIGTTVDFKAIDKNGKEFNEHIVNSDGIITNLIMHIKAPMIKPIVINADDGTHKLDIAICYDSNDDNIESITSFANFCPTSSGGTHVDGSIDGLTRWFCNYMNNIYLVNQKSKDKLKIISADIRNNVCLMISAAHLEPILLGQHKDQLSNEDMIQFCRQTVMNGLDNWSKSNPQDLAKLCKFFKDMGELRIKQDKDKEKIVQKYSSSTATGGLPKKYVRPLGKEHIELIIVEGDK